MGKDITFANNVIALRKRSRLQQDHAFARISEDIRSQIQKYLDYCVEDDPDVQPLADSIMRELRIERKGNIGLSEKGRSEYAAAGAALCGAPTYYHFVYRTDCYLPIRWILAFSTKSIHSIDRPNACWVFDSTPMVTETTMAAFTDLCRYCRLFEPAQIDPPALQAIRDSANSGGARDES